MACFMLLKESYIGGFPAGNRPDTSNPRAYVQQREPFSRGRSVWREPGIYWPPGTSLCTGNLPTSGDWGKNVHNRASSRGFLYTFGVLRLASSTKLFEFYLGQHRTIAEASAVESPIRQETIGFPAHFFARAHNFKPPGRACQPEADSPMRT